MSESVSVDAALINLVAAAIKLSGAETKTPLAAMATLISPGFAITPYHVIKAWPGVPTAKVLLHFDARTNLPLEVEATVIARDPQLDFALLQLKSGFKVKLPEDLLSDELPPLGSAWQSIMMTPDKPTGELVEGIVNGSETIDGIAHLQLTANLQAEPGSSGAPIIVNNRIVGILGRGKSQSQSWYALPLAKMLASEQTGVLRDLLMYPRLSPSSRRAFNHAFGMCQTIGADTVHMEHLLAGLYEKPEGPTQKALAAAKISTEKLYELLSQEAESDFPHSGQYTPATLSSFPPLSGHVREALLKANEVRAEQRAVEIQSRHLLYGALSITHCSFIEHMLELGLSRESIVLTDETPALIGTPIIAGYQSDTAIGQDLLGISREVQSLCAVLAAKDVQPPLSLGLFGDWGSGKSFFMRQMEQQLNTYRAEAAADPDSPYCSDIVQLWFNAWHYIDTELWASLAQNIFDGLKESFATREAVAQGQEDPAYKRAALLAQAVRAKEELAGEQANQRDLQIQVEQTEKRLSELEKGEVEINLSPGQALREAYRFAARQPEARTIAADTKRKFTEDVERAATQLNINSEQVKAQLLETQGLWQQCRALWLALRYTTSLWWIVSAMLFIVILLAGLFLLPLWQTQNDEWRNLLLKFGTWISPVIAFMAGLAPYFPAARRTLTVLNDAVEENRRSLEKKRSEMEKALQSKSAELQQKLQVQQKAVVDKSAALMSAEEELEKLRADRQIADFIKQRSASTEYTKYNGVIARVREDFNQLSGLLAKERAQREQGTQDAKLILPRIDRVVLYIDDLDRCPEQKVVEVLQAVHLLLAFPLFVVVVGVDPRWLLHSLKQHSSAFRDAQTEDSTPQDEESNHWRSTPLNYLEKIFQIPFTLKPMADTGFHQLIDNLAATQQTAANAPPANETEQTTQETSETIRSSADTTIQSEASSLEADHVPQFDQSDTQVAGATRQSTPLLYKTVKSELSEKINPSHLRFEEWERQAMKQLFSLIPSPRAAKRFVNIYRLLRVSVAEDLCPAFISATAPGQHRAALLLLALQIGYPAETTDLLRALLKRRQEKKWWDFIGEFKPKTSGPAPLAEPSRWEELLNKLQLKEVRALIPPEQTCEHFITWAEEVARYSFQSGRVLLD